MTHRKATHRATTKKRKFTRNERYKTANNTKQRLHDEDKNSYIINLSKRQLTPPQLSLLTKGLGFVPNTRHTPDYTKGITKLTRSLRLRHHFSGVESATTPNTTPPFKPRSTWQPPTADGTTESYLADLPRKLEEMETRPFQDNLTKAERAALTELRRDDTIIIRNADKGSCLVVEDREQYTADGLAHLSDPEVYEVVTEDPTAALAASITAYASNMERKGYLTKHMANFISRDDPGSTRTPQMYFTKKLHKGPRVVRPIVSGCDGPTEKMSALMDHFLQPLVQRTFSYVKDSSDVIRKLENISVQEDCILVTIDVKSLYTNIPQDEGVASAIRHLYSHNNPNRGDVPFPPSVAEEMLRMILEKNFFEFDGKVYRQRRGTAMGTKMAPAYANLFMADMETRFLEGEPIKPRLWLRFIDDILTLWPGSRQSLLEFMTRLNSIHPDLQFTFEDSLLRATFLDLELHKGERFSESGVLDTRLHLKATNRFQYLHHSSAHPRSTFRGIVRGELTRTLRASSDEGTFEQTARLLGNKFTARGYPMHLVSKTLQEVPFSSRAEKLEEKQPSTETLTPFITPHSDQVPRAELTKALQPPEGDNPPTLCFTKGRDVASSLVRARLRGNTRPTRVGQEVVMAKHTPIFASYSVPCGTTLCGSCKMMSKRAVVFGRDGKPHKTPQGTNCDSRGLVYLLECTACEAPKGYVGQTSRTLRERLNGHRRAAADGKNMPIYKHLKNGHTFSHLRVTILEVLKHPNNTNLLQREERWIQMLGTRLPRGLNSHYSPLSGDTSHPLTPNGETSHLSAETSHSLAPNAETPHL